MLVDGGSVALYVIVITVLPLDNRNIEDIAMMAASCISPLFANIFWSFQFFCLPLYQVLLILRTGAADNESCS